MLARIASVMICLAVASSASAAGLPRMYKAQGGSEVLAAAQASGKPIMIYFWQPRCGYCDQVEELLATSEVRFRLVENYHFMNVRLGASGDPVVNALKKLLDVRGTPAFAFLSPKGEVICMLYGMIRDDEALAELDRNVMAFFGGARVTATSRGFPSCRGSKPLGDERVTSYGPPEPAK